MDFIAPISRTFVSPIWAKWEKSAYLQHYRKLLKTQYDPIDTIKNRQLSALKDILTHAYNTTPFWRDRFNNSGLSPSDINSLSDLSKLPIFIKSDLREQTDRLLSKVYDKATLHKHTTSGSTGVSVVTYSDDDCQQFKRGSTLRSDEWSGWKFGERIASIWGNPQIRTDWKGKIRNALLDRHYVYLDTLKMNEREMDRFTGTLIKKSPSMLFGHAHSLYLFASYLDKKRPNVKIRPKGILSTCMVLHDFERNLIEKTFSCPVTNRYGCEEVSLIACECRKGEGLHVNSDCIYLEIIDQEGNPCPPGIPGRIVVTDLKNKAMPIIRYEVGDMATWSDKPCSCGRTLPLLLKIEGRVADYVVTPTGEYISGISLTENFAVQVPGVAQLQIIQEKIDKFTFNIVKGIDFSNKSIEKISGLVKERFGEQVSFECRYMDKIPQEKSGKYRFCISKVDKPF